MVRLMPRGVPARPTWRRICAVFVGFVLLAGSPALLVAGPDAARPMQVYWAHGRIVVGIYPESNEGYIQIARRVMEHPEQHEEVREFNGGRPVMAGIAVKFPLVMLKPALR